MCRAYAAPWLAACAPITVAFGLAGCMGRGNPAYDSDSPNERLEAIVEAGQERNPEDVRKLVEQLDSPDAATRMLAITALRQIEGRDFGYRYEDPEWKRRVSVNRWTEYLARSGTDAGGAGQSPTARTAGG